MDDRKMTWVIGGLLILAALAYAASLVVGRPPAETDAQPAPTTPGEVFCTMEAKMCPDGSYVGRGGPDCAFAPCPGASVEVQLK